MKATNPLYNEIQNQYTMVWKDTKMVDYCMNKIQIAVKLTDGSIITFDKPCIKTNFCFGWDTFGDNYHEAVDSAICAQSSKDYFLCRNLKEIEDWIEHAKDDSRSLYLYDNYRPDVRLKHYVLLDSTYDLWMFNNARLSDNETADRQQILDALQTIKLEFTKRLETWWKRYGASHVKTWTYCRDD